ncbi:MAG: D-alanine--D-alanine ligase [Gammaproteobacteria bacterium]|nr:MAG: D-alanine--D-alanine ligase [Gammaproteobacteria bacterium]
MSIAEETKNNRKPEEYGKVAVLMGGWAAERDVSLNSGAAVLDALQSQGVDAHKIDVDRGIVSVLEEGGFDRAFNILHGRGGEDGVIQGVLEALNIPYTGSGILASSVSMNKLRTKQMWMGAGLRTPPLYVSVKEDFDYAALERLGFPLMVKPVKEGSSIGMSKVNNIGQVEEAWRLAREYDQCVIAEKWIAGREFTVAVLGDRTLPIVSVETPEEFFDYEAKYTLNTTKYFCPCGLEEQREKELSAMAKLAFNAVGASGWGRVDFILDDEDTPWLIEVNTVPGMTDHSLVPMAAREAGIEFEELVLHVLETSMNKDRERG